MADVPRKEYSGFGIEQRANYALKSGSMPETRRLVTMWIALQYEGHYAAISYSLLRLLVLIIPELFNGRFLITIISSLFSTHHFILICLDRDNFAKLKLKKAIVFYCRSINECDNLFHKRNCRNVPALMTVKQLLLVWLFFPTSL